MENDRIGQVLGIWRLDKPIGRGGMGDVYLAHRIDGVVEQQAAVKFCILQTPPVLRMKPRRSGRSAIRISYGTSTPP